MNIKAATCLTFLSFLMGFSIQSGATVITFAGGTATLGDASTQTTNNSGTISNVNYYEEGGFKLDFIGGNEYIGNYYGTGNAVIHGHWATGDYGGMTMIKVTKLDNTAFDLNYFVLTSNADQGGGLASGLERAFIHASTDGTTDSYSQLLPPENWGFPATSIFLGSQFDGIKAFWFTAENAVDCFGMDSFFINEAAPGLCRNPARLPCWAWDWPAWSVCVASPNISIASAVYKKARHHVGPFSFVRPAWAHSWRWKSSRKLITANEAKRNCMRVTECGEEAWSEAASRWTRTG